jgi:hypothetical protein
MPQSNKAGLDWPTIQARYLAGESASALAKEFSVSRQAIMKRGRKEGWARETDHPGITVKKTKEAPDNGTDVTAPDVINVTPDLPSSTWLVQEPSPFDRYGLRNDANRALAIQMAAEGSTVTMIAGAIGMTTSAFKHWRDDDKLFDAQITEALSRDARATLNGVNGAIVRGDARAAQWKLEKHPLVKDDYTNPRDGGGGPTIIVINVPRNAEQLEALQSTGRIGQAKVIEAEVTEVSG